MKKDKILLNEKLLTVSPPEDPILWQTYFDRSTEQLKAWDGSTWIVVAESGMIYHSLSNGTKPEQKFICSLCLFKPRLRSKDDDPEDDILTVIGGEMVCVYHQGYVTPISGARQFLLTEKD